MYQIDDLIVAPATGRMQAAPIAVLRLSGVGCWDVVMRHFRARTKGSLRPWQARYGEWVDRHGLVDDLVLLPFRAPRSYTGEDMCEIYCHGNPLFVDAIEASLIKAGARRAEPGEFTQRALINGRMSLLEVEALHDLIDAKTRYHADLLRRQEHGPLVTGVNHLVEQILAIQAHIEASIDYGEEDVDALEREDLCARLAEILERLHRLASTAEFAIGIKRGFRVLLAGAPNVGKSTLFNALLARERAIVSDQPGTTRDYLTEEIEIGGLPVVLIDTAGLRETQDVIEQEGVRRVQALFGDVDLVILLTTSSQPERPGFPADLISNDRILVVGNKADQGRQDGGVELSISAQEGTGLDQLEREIVLRLSSAVADQDAYLINQRQRESVQCAADLIAQSIDDFSRGVGEEVLSSYLNQARRALGELTGETTVEDILDRMFATFCLGK